MNKDDLKNALEVIAGARVNIMDYGWRQGSYGNAAEGMCISGALLQQPECRKVDAAVDLIEEILGVGPSTCALGAASIIVWNDRVATSVDQVIAALDQAESLALSELEAP